MTMRRDHKILWYLLVKRKWKHYGLCAVYLEKWITKPFNFRRLMGLDRDWLGRGNLSKVAMTGKCQHSKALLTMVSQCKIGHEISINSQDFPIKRPRSHLCTTLLNFVRIQSTGKKRSETTSYLYSWLGDKETFWCGTEFAGEPSSIQTSSLANDRTSSTERNIALPQNIIYSWFAVSQPMKGHKNWEFIFVWKKPKISHLLHTIEGNQLVIGASGKREIYVVTMPDGF